MASPLPPSLQQMLAAAAYVDAQRAATSGYGDLPLVPTTTTIVPAADTAAPGAPPDTTGVSATLPPSSVPVAPTFAPALVALANAVGPIGQPTVQSNGARVLSATQQAQFRTAIDGVGATVSTASSAPTSRSDTVVFERTPSAPPVAASSWIAARRDEGKAVLMTVDPATATMGLVAATPRAADQISAATSSAIVATPSGVSPLLLAAVGLGAAAVGFVAWKHFTKKAA